MIKSVDKVWGHEEWLVNTDLYCFKKLYLAEGYRCSMHHHKIKDETFIVEKGHVRMEVGLEVLSMYPGDQVHIPPNTEHRFSGLTDSIILEVSTTHMEEDSYRSEESGQFNLTEY